MVASVPASASVGAPGVEPTRGTPSVQVYILGSSCLLTFCQLADFTAAKYDSRLMRFGGRSDACFNQPIISSSVSCRHHRLRCRKPTVTEGDPSRIFQWRAVHVLNAFEYQVHDGV